MKLRTEDLTWREIDGETVVLDLRTSRYLKTNRSGTLLLKMLSEDRSRDDLIDALVYAYTLDRARAAVDVDAFMMLLVAKRMLDGSEATS